MLVMVLREITIVSVKVTVLVVLGSNSMVLESNSDSVKGNNRLIVLYAKEVTVGVIRSNSDKC
jgi:hypothetical protein